MAIFTWVAVAVVVGLLIGFVTLTVIWMARSVSQNIRERSIELLSAYDELLEERSRELSALDVELEQREKELQEPKDAPVAPAAPAEPETVQAPTTFLKAAEQLATTPYRDNGAGEAYQRIRQTFAAVSDATLRRLMTDPRETRQGSASRLLRMLPFDTVYQLSTLSSGEQLQLLRETIPDEMRDILESYAAATQHFDCIVFYDTLKAAAALEPQPIRLRIAAQDVKYYPAFLNVTVDEDICEGFQIELDNVLYDYAIKTREIG